MTKTMSEMTDEEVRSARDRYQAGVGRTSVFGFPVTTAGEIYLILANQYDAELTRRSKEK